MTDCPLCQAAAGKSNLGKIYEDERFIAAMHPEPASLGHVLVFPKNHYQIFEQVPDYEAAELFNLVNKLSSSIFEATNAKGTNVMIQNGIAAGQKIPHVVIHIIPRDEGDNIDFQWQPKQLNEEQMSSVEVKLKEGAKNIGNFEKEEKKEPVDLKQEPEKESKQESEEPEENYLIKKLERIP